MGDRLKTTRRLRYVIAPSIFRDQLTRATAQLFTRYDLYPHRSSEQAFLPVSQGNAADFRGWGYPQFALSAV